MLAESLLARLEDELLLERLWGWHLGALAHGAPRPHARAAGMFACAESLAGAAETLRVARDVVATAEPCDEALRRLAQVLQPKTIEAFPPALHHHAALYFGKVADALEDVTAHGSVHFRTRSIASWIALADERRYLATLAADIVAGALPEAELSRAVDAAPFEPIEELARVAKAGARDLSGRGKAALLALAEVGDACAMARATDPTAHAMKRRAASRRLAAIEEAVAPISQALEEASASGDATRKGVDILGRCVGVWEWAGRDEAVEQFAVDRLAPIAWELYRADRWADLSKLLDGVDLLTESLATRIEGDASRIAYAASCAEVLVFKAQMASPLDRRLEIAERALRVCPSHRNGRLVLSSYLCEHAVLLVAGRGAMVRRRDCAAANACVDRAEKLFPANAKIAAARELVASAKRRAVL